MIMLSVLLLSIISFKVISATMTIGDYFYIRGLIKFCSIRGGTWQAKYHHSTLTSLVRRQQRSG